MIEGNCGEDEEREGDIEEEYCRAVEGGRDGGRERGRNTGDRKGRNRARDRGRERMKGKEEIFGRGRKGHSDP